MEILWNVGGGQEETGVGREEKEGKGKNSGKTERKGGKGGRGREGAGKGRKGKKGERQEKRGKEGAEIRMIVLAAEGADRKGSERKDQRCL